jgi:hypothetical protein
MSAQDQGFFEFVRQHMINVAQSLYQCDGTDDNPINIDDTIEEVVAKMADGVYRDGHPELLDNEVQTLFWAIQNEAVNTEWQSPEVMLKEIHIFGKKTTEEKTAELLDVQPWDIKDRTATEEGIRLVWIGVVLRKLAIDARLSHEAQRIIKDKRTQGNDNE